MFVEQIWPLTCPPAQVRGPGTVENYLNEIWFQLRVMDVCALWLSVPVKST